MKISLNELKNLVKSTLKEMEDEDSNVAYGYEDIKKLRSKLKSDEYVMLDDSSGELRGKIVKKHEYVLNMLNDAKRKQDWAKVENAMSFIRTQM
jgi:ribosome biogenesis protein Nip4